MAKPKAPVWLRQAFRDGVIELMPDRPAAAYKGALGRCWLAQFDGYRRPCEGPFERFHFVNRQRVENSLWALMPYNPVDIGDPASIFDPRLDKADLILLAAWDPRNGGVACEAHHRRLDSHAMPALILPQECLPGHVIEFAEDWGIESQLEARFPPEHTFATADPL